MSPISPLPRAIVAGALLLVVACGSGDKGTGPGSTVGSLTATSGVVVGGRAGLVAVDTPVVLVKTAAGAPLAGVPVVFSVLSGGGTITSGGLVVTTLSVNSNASGLAGVKWRFGGTLGAQTLQAKVDTFPAVVFTATVTGGPTGLLVVVAGNNQTAPANTLIPLPLQVRATDAFGNIVAGDTIDFTSTLGANTLTQSRQVTNASGLATLAGWTVGGCAGLATVTATSRSLGNPAIPFNATVTGGGNYCIELVYTATPDPVLRASAENAAARWSRVITSTLGVEVLTQSNFPCAGISGLTLSNRSIKSVVIFVQLAPIASTTPGLVTLGSAGPCFIRSDNGLTIVGGLRLNSDYLLNNLNANQREDVVLHEMGHVLGFGTLWTGQSSIPALPVLVSNPTSTGGVGNPTLVGLASLAEFASLLGGGSPSGVPVENCGGGGTINGHWREGSYLSTPGVGFGTELMTGYISAPAGQRNPFSRLSIAAMSDLGYAVSYAEADAYVLNAQACPGSPGGNLLAPAQGAVMVGTDWVIEELRQPTHLVRRGRVEPLITRK